MAKTARIGRRLAIAATLIAAAGPAGAATVSVPTSTDAGGNMILGYPKAPVTVAEFASVGCPHCAKWATTVYPAFKAKYIDTGKARFEFHEMLTGNPTLAAVGFLVARCAGASQYFFVVDQVFAKQGVIATEGGPALVAIAHAAGLTDDGFKACLSDDAAVKALGERTEADATAHHVTGTPTFFVNGVRLDGEQNLAALDAAILKAGRR